MTEEIIKNTKTEMIDKNTEERPTLVTLICMLGILLSVGNIILRFNALYIKAQPAWYMLDSFAILSSILDLVCYLFILKMKKIGVYFYSIFYLLNNIFLFIFGFWSAGGFGLQGVVVTYLLIISKRMK